MAQLAAKIVDQAPAAPAAAAIDRGHLARMRDREPAAVATLAHTLKGSACSIGATGVMGAAEAVEQAASAAECDLAIGRLATTIDAARAAIAELLGALQG
jgi:HPt (histidine-containing phosphotransfer) domain-containing protein